jgi:hypothetical protein
MVQLPVEQHVLYDGQATFAFAIKERVKHAKSLSCLLSHLVDMC